MTNGYTLKWSEKRLVIEKVNNAVSWVYIRQEINGVDFLWKWIKNFQEKLRNSNTRLTSGKIKQIDAYTKLSDHISVNTA